MKEVAEGDISDDLRDQFVSRMRGIETDEDAFWQGFIHGVRAFVVEKQIGETARRN